LAVVNSLAVTEFGMNAFIIMLGGLAALRELQALCQAASHGGKGHFLADPRVCKRETAEYGYPDPILLHRCHNHRCRNPGKNQSAFHRDILKELLPEGAVYLDGKVSLKNGRFVT
jgi:hypothetical protein